MFSPGSFKLVDFTLRAMIHFEWTCVCGVRQGFFCPGWISCMSMSSPNTIRCKNPSFSVELPALTLTMNWSFVRGPVSGLYSVPLTWDLLLSRCHVVLATVCWDQDLKSGSVSPPALFWLSKSVILVSLSYHIHFKNRSLISADHFVGTLVGMAANLYIGWVGSDFLAVFGLALLRTLVFRSPWASLTRVL